MTAAKGNQYSKKENPCTAQIGIRLTPEMWSLYRQEARSCGKSVSDIIKDSVEHQIYERMARGGEFFTCEGRKKLAFLLKQTGDG